MKHKTFIDSNIFLYTLDNGNVEKKEKAAKSLADLSKTSRIFISTQVLNEVYAVATRKLHVDPVLAKKFLKQLYDFDVIIITYNIIEAAIDCSILNQISYWDALMVAAAESVNCTALWTEDLGSNSEIKGISIINPLK